MLSSIPLLSDPADGPFGKTTLLVSCKNKKASYCMSPDNILSNFHSILKQVEGVAKHKKLNNQLKKSSSSQPLKQHATETCHGANLVSLSERTSKNAQVPKITYFISSFFPESNVLIK